MKVFLQVAVLASIFLGFFWAYPEYRARDDAEKSCASIALNARLDVDRQSLDNTRKELKPKFGSLYVVNFFADDAGKPNASGGVVLVFLGGFPFGREFCALKLKEGLVVDKRVVFDADDYQYCKGDVRLVTECG